MPRRRHPVATGAKVLGEVAVGIDYPGEICQIAHHRQLQVAPPRLVLLGEGQIEQPVSGTEEEGYVRCMACAVDEVERRRARCRTPAEVVGIGLWLVLADHRGELIDIL